jgi:hypothetical protein
VIKRPIDNADPALDEDVDKPRAPNFLRQAVDALTGRAAPTAREAEQAALEARQREDAARAAAAAAKREREEAERALPAARARAQQAAADVQRQAEARLKGLSEQLDAAIRRETAADGERPSPDERLRARSWLHAGGTESGRALMELAALDPVLAGYLDAQQAAGRLMKWVFDEGASDDAADRADELEITAWGHAMARVKSLAGES